MLSGWLQAVWASLSAAPGSAPEPAAAVSVAGQAVPGQLGALHSALPQALKAAPALAAAAAEPAELDCQLSHGQHRLADAVAAVVALQPPV